MDRLNQLRGEGGGTGDSSLDRSYPASDAYLTADESSAYYSLQNNSTFNTSPSKNESPINEDTIKSSDTLLPDLSPIRQNTDVAFNIDEQIESANILSSDVHLFEDSSFDGNELVIDDKIEDRTKDEMKTVEDSTFQKSECSFVDETLVDTETDIPSKDTEVVLQIDGKNVDAIDIGNGLYLYRKEGKEELAVVQIIDDDQQQPSFKFLKVRENSEGNLEVYEEIEVEVPKELNDKSASVENSSHVPIKDISKVISDPGNKSCERKTASCTEKSTILSKTEVLIPDTISENKNEVNLNVKVMKISEAHKSPIIGSFKPMTYHSTPNKEGVPLTKTMVEQQLHPNRNSENIKKTIEVHTDGSKQKASEPPGKTKDTTNDIIKVNESTVEILQGSTQNLLTVSCEQSKSNNKDQNSQIIEKETKVIDKLSDKEGNRKDKNTNLQPENIEIEKEETKTGETVASIGLKISQSEIETKKHKESNEHTYSEYVNVIESPSVQSSERELTSTSTPDATEVQSKIKTNPCEITDVAYSSKNIQGDINCLKSSPILLHKVEAITQVLKKSEDLINLGKSPEKIIHVSKPKPADILNNSVLNKDLQTISSVGLNTTNSPKKQLNEQRDTVSSKELFTSDCKEQKNVTKQIAENKAMSIQPKKLQLNKNPVIIKNVPKLISNIEIKSTPINNNHAAVPFGQWTEANRQEFLNKIRESKLPVNSANTNQIKQTNDLNRRDVLKKFDSQRQSNIAIAKAQELKALTKHNNKNEPLFLNKPLVISKNSEPEKIKNKETKSPTIINSKDKDAESSPKKDLMQHLIDKTIEGMINRVPVKTVSEDTAQIVEETIIEQKNPALSVVSEQLKNKEFTSLEDIEKKMNELHGIPFIERPPHELPQIHKVYKSDDQKSPTKPNKSSALPPSIKKSQDKIVNENVDYSDDEVIEHEPVTGDIVYNKSNTLNTVPISQAKLPFEENVQQLDNKVKKNTIITEKDFDHFAKRNASPCESHIESTNKVSKVFDMPQSVLDGRTIAEKNNQNNISHSDSKSPNQQNKVPVVQNSTLAKNKEEVPLKNYHSKLQMAYQSALTAKRQMESPITIIEEKPVKVIFMDTNPDFSPTQVHELSPSKRLQGRADTNSVTTADSKDSDICDPFCESKTHDELRNKSKHQRKQVLTPVDTTDIELIEPGDLGIEVSSKRRKRVEDVKTDRNPMNLLSKKSYLLSRETAADDKTNVLALNKRILDQNDAVTAIDSLVKAAELIETQQIQSTQNSQNTPVKRGRGRPRKYPLPEGAMMKDNIPSPQKKSRLINATPTKSVTSSEEDYDSDGTIIKENWTMGKINENLVCPICQKLFRSENVIFKHVKHCTGPSPNRSEKGSSRRYRESQDSDSKSSENYKSDVVIYRPNVRRKSRETVSNITSENDIILIEDTPLKKREHNPQEKKNITKTSSSSGISKSETSKNFKFKSKPTIVDEDIIVINDTPPQKNQKPETNKMATKTKSHTKSDNLTCEICGKKFRQLSYLVSHKMQHKKEPKMVVNDTQSSNSIVFSCETCQKVFRKLHHLVQHRIIHNAPSTTAYKSRKSSANDVTESKVANLIVKQNEEQSAGFRCEPCDKSFRKLHHLVEHRETHDGINRQKNNSNLQHNADKATSPQCDVCKKVFRKLHHLIEHREQHLENKSEDKSTKSSLSTKDIIHECSLCYMVFPNEHSLNKHHVICQRKKKQSTAKQVKETDPANNDVTEVDDKLKTNVSNDINDIEDKVYEESDPKEHFDDIMDVKKCVDSENIITENTITEILEESNNIIEDKTQTNEPLLDQQSFTEKLVLETQSEANEIVSDIKMDVEQHPVVIPKNQIKVAPKNKISVKDKVPQTVTKRQKTSNLPLPVVDDVKSYLELSDDEDVRYMINPDFNDDDSLHKKMFMKISATKRDSLAIKKNITKRKISTQYPPKIPRLKQGFETKASQSSEAFTKNIPKPNDEESVPSDDCDVKYSFPKTFSQITEQKTHSKNKTEKRKSLGGIAKRKSLGKIKPQKYVQKRIKEIGYKCDCGQLFSSAALLSRHTTLAHTPPRIRRRKSPPPEIDKTVKIDRRKSSTTTKPGVKKLVKNDTTLNTKNDVSKAAVKTEITRPAIKNENAKPTNDTTKSIGKNETSIPAVKNDVVKSTTKIDVTKPSVKNETTKSVPKIEEDKTVFKTDPTKTIVKKDANKIVTKLGTSRKLSVNKTDAKGPSDTRKSEVKSGLVKPKLRRTTTHGGVPLPQKMKSLGKM